MNVDLLKDNPDWRWHILVGGIVMTLTIVGWLMFKFDPVCGTLECYPSLKLLTHDAGNRIVD